MYFSAAVFQDEYVGGLVAHDVVGAGGDAVVSLSPKKVASSKEGVEWVAEGRR